MTVAAKPLAAVLLFLGLLVAAALPGMGTHTGDGNMYDGEPVNLQNAVVPSLTILRAPNATLTNVTINGPLKIYSSEHVRLTAVTVNGAFELFDGADIGTSILKVSGETHVNRTHGSSFHGDTYQKQIKIRGSTVAYANTTFNGGCLETSNVTITNSQGTFPVVCGNTTTAPTFPTPTPPTFTPSPTPNTTSPSPTTKPTSSFTYPDTFFLEGKQILQDLYISSASDVVIRDVTVYGNLGIYRGAKVTLERVRVSGEAMIDQTGSLSATGLQVDGRMGLSYVTNFRLGASTIGSDLGCFRCVRGTLSDLTVGGQVHLVESYDVQQTNVRSVSGERPLVGDKPTTAPVVFNATDDSLTFVHVKAADVQASVAVDAVLAKAKLELADPATPGSPAVRLESHFEKLIECDDRDGDGRCGLSDRVLAEHLLDDLPAQVRQQRSGEGGDEAWIGTLDYALPNGATVRLIFTTRDQDPDRTKIDVEILDYVYRTDSSRVSLQIRLESTHEWTLKEGDVQDCVSFLGTGYDGVFCWVHEAAADGVMAPVDAQILEAHHGSGDKEVVLLLGYPRARHIFHDPSLGLEEALGLPGLPPLGNVLVYGSTFLAVIIVLWAMGQNRRRTV